MARKFSNSPGRASRFASRVVAVARFVVGAFAILVLAVPVTMDDDAAPPMRLVDDGGGDGSSSDPPYSPSPSGESPSPSDGPSGTDGDKGKNPPPAEEAAAGIPVAAQAGISLGVIALAALALLPGRRPPAHLR